jgi:hypothetical protein
MLHRSAQMERQSDARLGLSMIFLLFVATFWLPVLRAAGDDEGAGKTKATPQETRAHSAPRAIKAIRETAKTQSASEDGIDGIVLMPDSRPAAHAQVALGVDGSRIVVTNGEFYAHLSDAKRTETDRFGRFHFPPEDSAYYLVIMHPTGYVLYKPTAKTNRRIINLDPWTRVEGTYRVGGKPQAKIPLTILGPDLDLPERHSPQISIDGEATTGPDGRFLFERVRAGRGLIGRMFPRDLIGAPKMGSSLVLATKFPVGKTLRVDVGSTGRTVVGKFRPAPGFKGTVRWGSEHFTIYTKGIEGLPAESYFSVTFGSDGAFRIDDMPPGDYCLFVVLMPQSAGCLVDYHLSIPRIAAAESAKPIDLGVLTLQND